ncbi:GHKL domain-containing protein [bacterium D16-54]|nr:GHKL domain-containing protein [bacterium D16-54]RKJ16545.1 GHKL domain-containing protein [bacterium D16-56]
MSEAVNVWDVFLMLILYFFYAWCASCFLKNQLQGKKREEGVFGGLLFCIYGALAFFLSGVPYIFYAICSHGALVGLTMAVFRGEREKKFLAAVMLAAMTVLVWNFTESFFSCLGLIGIHAAVGNDHITVMGGWVERAVLLMTYGAGILVINRLSKPCADALEDKRKSWYLSLSVPLSCMILVTDFVNWAASNGIMVQAWGKYGLYENQLFSHGAMCIFTGLAMAAAGFFVFAMNRIDQEERAGEQYRSQVMYYQMMEEQYSRMERLRHDMKNHMLALDNLVQNRQWENAGCYLKEMTEAGGVEAGDEITGSLVIDALLYHKRRQAMSMGIRWQCDARLPKDCKVKEMDLCIIVGNILDNALEACFKLQEKKPEKGDGGEDTKKTKDQAESFIEIYMGTIKKCLFLEVRNSTDLPDELEFCRTRKASPKEHGLGLMNIKTAAARYHGAVHMEVKNRVFAISVLLPLYKEEPMGPA